MPWSMDYCFMVQGGGNYTKGEMEVRGIAGYRTEATVLAQHMSLRERAQDIGGLREE